MRSSGLRILLVEDDVDLADAVCSYLRAKAFVVDVVGRLDEARSALLTAQYSAVLLDLHLEDGDGLSLMPAVRALREQPAVIVLTARDQVSDRIRGLDAGADDYLTKPFAFEELFARLRALTRRGPIERPVVLAVGDLTLDPVSHVVRRGDERIALSAKEFALLEFLMRHPDEVLSRSRILEHVWDFAYDGGSNVDDVYVRYLREKIDRPFGRSDLETVRGVGYRLSTGSEPSPAAAPGAGDVRPS